MTPSRAAHKRRHTVLPLAGLTLVGALAMSACADDTASTSKKTDTSGPVAGGTLEFSLANDPISLNPRTSGSGNDTQYVQRQFLDSLTDQDPATGKITPWLAESWKVNDDATAFTFTLRTDVTFSDGSALTAQVVKDNFDDIVKNAASATSAITALPAYAGTTVSDDRTFTVSFSKPDGAFLQAASTTPLGIVAESTLKVPYAQRADGSKVVGSGPFVLERYTPNTSVVLSRRADYAWAPAQYTNRGAAHLDKVQFNIVPEAGVRTGSLSSDQADVIGGVLPQDEATLKSSGYPLVVRSNPGVPFGLSPFLKAGGPLTDENVRKALLTAIDRKTIQASALSPDFKIATAPLAANTPGWVNLSSELGYDPKASEKLLDEAGWKVGRDGVREKDGVPLALTLGWITNFNPNQAIVQLVQQQLQKIGIRVTLWSGTVPQLLTAESSGKIDVLYDNLSRADGDILRTKFSSATTAKTNHFNDPKLDALLTAQLGTADQAERNSLAQQAAKQIIADGYNTPIVELTTILGTGKNVHGVGLGADSRLGLLVDAYKSK